MTATLSLAFTFHAPADRVWECLFGDVRDVQRYTQSRAVIEARQGGVYSIFDGQITGTFVEAAVAKTVLSWRMKNWTDGVFSTATLTLEQRGTGECFMKLVQTGVPLRDAHDNPDQEIQVERGWRERIIGGIQKFVGIAADEEKEDE